MVVRDAEFHLGELLVQAGVVLRTDRLGQGEQDEDAHYGKEQPQGKMNMFSILAGCRALSPAGARTRVSSPARAAMRPTGICRASSTPVFSAATVPMRKS